MGQEKKTDPFKNKPQPKRKLGALPTPVKSDNRIMIKLLDYRVSKKALRTPGRNILIEETRAPEFLANIEEMKKVENALRESEARFRQVAEKIPQVLYLSDTQKSRMLYVSPAYQKVWGQPLERIYENAQSL